MTTIDKTVVGAINEIDLTLNNKQDKLTNPLTQSDVINNLISDSTINPLSAAQGKALKSAILTQTESTSIVPTNAIAIQNSYIFKVGNLAILSIQAVTKQAMSGQTIICTTPTGYTAKRLTFGVVWLSGVDKTARLYMDGNTRNVYFQTSGGYSSNYEFSGFIVFETT